MTIKKPPFLTKPYSAYYHSDVLEDDKELTRVGPGTPAGEYLRRFWQPVAYTEQLTDLPLPIKVMCEELVLFRSHSGRIGLLELHCSHRGTSLEFGLIEESGIRCCYHGWLFDVDGRILDTPGEPPDSTYKERLCHGAYPVIDYRGVLFAYMGPREKMPDFPKFDLFDSPGYRLEANSLSTFSSTSADGKLTPMYLPCNWLQDVDNFCDPSHERFLHATISGIQFFNDLGEPIEELAQKSEDEYMETPIGILTLESRRVRPDSVWVRNIEFIWPNMASLGRGDVLYHEWGPEETEVHAPPRLVWAVPIDDTNHMMLDMVLIPNGEEFSRSLTLSRTGRYHSPGNPKSYEEMQRGPGDYEAQVGQRAIAVHAMEHLGATDRGVAMMRKGLRRRVRMVQQDLDPPELEELSKGMVPTHAGDSLLRVPEANTPAEDKPLLRRVAMEMGKRYIKVPPNMVPSD